MKLISDIVGTWATDLVSESWECPDQSWLPDTVSIGADNTSQHWPTIDALTTPGTEHRACGTLETLVTTGAVTTWVWEDLYQQCLLHHTEETSLRSPHITRVRQESGVSVCSGHWRVEVVTSVLQSDQHSTVLSLVWTFLQVAATPHCHLLHT